MGLSSSDSVLNPLLIVPQQSSLESFLCGEYVKQHSWSVWLEWGKSDQMFLTKGTLKRRTHYFRLAPAATQTDALFVEHLEFRHSRLSSFHKQGALGVAHVSHVSGRQMQSYVFLCCLNTVALSGEPVLCTGNWIWRQACSGHLTSFSWYSGGQGRSGCVHTFAKCQGDLNNSVFSFKSVGLFERKRSCWYRWRVSHCEETRRVFAKFTLSSARGSEIAPLQRVSPQHNSRLILEEEKVCSHCQVQKFCLTVRVVTPVGWVPSTLCPSLFHTETSHCAQALSQHGSVRHVRHPRQPRQQGGRWTQGFLLPGGCGVYARSIQTLWVCWIQWSRWVLVHSCGLLVLRWTPKQLSSVWNSFTQTLNSAQASRWAVLTIICTT